MLVERRKPRNNVSVSSQKLTMLTRLQSFPNNIITHRIIEIRLFAPTSKPTEIITHRNHRFRVPALPLRKLRWRFALNKTLLLFVWSLKKQKLVFHVENTHFASSERKKVLKTKENVSKSFFRKHRVWTPHYQFENPQKSSPAEIIVFWKRAVEMQISSMILVGNDCTARWREK